MIWIACDELGCGGKSIDEVPSRLTKLDINFFCGIPCWAESKNHFEASATMAKIPRR
jgi:hypothetical protein